MYSDEQTVKWSERSFSLEYQEAYSNIIGVFPSQWKTFLDVGCGTGELLKRAWSIRRDACYVGSDATPEMLEIARDNLRESGIPVRIVPDLEDSLIPGEISLLLDNISYSEIPPYFADLTSFTFPETYAYEDDRERIIKEFSRKMKSKFGISDERILLKWGILNQIVDKIKLRGTFVYVPYDIRSENPEYERNSINGLKKVAKSIGLNIKGRKFFESSEVWSDTYENKYFESGETPGYRIFKFTREK